MRIIYLILFICHTIGSAHLIDNNDTLVDYLFRYKILTRNYENTIALVEEILLQPRWDEEQFELVKSRMLNSTILKHRK